MIQSGVIPVLTIPVILINYFMGIGLIILVLLMIVGAFLGLGYVKRKKSK